MKLTYHAWISENIGVEEEYVTAETGTLQDLIAILKNQGSIHEQIFSKLDKIYIAVNDRMVRKNELETTLLSSHDTISFFPAISGG